MAGPAAAASPTTAGCSIPSASTPCCSISAAPGEAAPRAAAKHNTLPHLIADMEMIREKFGFERWMVVGGSWGATLALAYAQAHPERVTGIVLRATFLGTRAELEGAFLDALPRFYPGLHDDFLSVLPPEERAQPLDAYWRRILDSDPAVHGPAARAWHDTERILSEHAPGADPARSRVAEFDRRPARHAVHGSALFPERLLHETEPASGGSRQAQRIFPASSCRAATICCARRRPRMRWPRAGRDAEIRFVEGAGHSLYDPGVRDAVMKAIADMASKITA